MRVIAGEFRSRRIKSLPGPDLRPTPDRLRETLFDILATRIERATFLDAYAGTGAVGIEALSRGAARAIFIERSRPAQALIAENLRSLGLLAKATVVAAPALKELARHLADIVFLDPPYTLEHEYPQALQLIARTPARLVIAQHDSRYDPGENYGSLDRYRTVKQGDNTLSFYRLSESE
jgi:16S rRNA (guanine(966)-N(2))-methyltransferase RsmD